MVSCAEEGGCPSDYVAVSISILSVILLVAKALAPYLIYKIPRPKGSSFWLVAIQVVASFNLLLSLVMAFNFLKLKRRHWWRSCYIWSVWVEGPLGFGLLLSCRIVQGFQLYNIFVKRRLPPIRSYIFLPLVLLPWIASSLFVHMKKPLNYRCHMRTQWVVPVIFLHALYVAALVGFTAAVQHIEFRFHELKDLWRGILVSACSIGIWVVAYLMNELHEDISWVQIVSRFLLLVMVFDFTTVFVISEHQHKFPPLLVLSLISQTSILVLAFFSISLSQPLVSLISLRRKDHPEYETMGRALGIPDSGVLLQGGTTEPIDPAAPLDKLLLNRKFRQSFMAFADSCLAGESVHFYDEVQQLEKVSNDDNVRRVYMARHIIDKYIASGGTMEVNISHRCRQEILSTLDLAQPDLFKNAVNELMQLMKMNLLNDYWSSTFFMKLKEEANLRTVNHELEEIGGWNFSHRLSSAHCADDPFQQEHSPSKPESNSCDSDIQ